MIGRFLESVFQDLRHGLRLMRRNPGFVIVAVVVLGLGIGANAAIFGMVNTLFLRPLPVEEPGRLVALRPIGTGTEGRTEQNDRLFVFGLALLSGLGAGLVTAFLLGLGMRSALYGVGVIEPAVLLAVSLILGTAALLASWLPARRALLIEPMLALRSE